jgi:HPt (histidine-containing phosphotransfer) domain-containing protein
MIEKENNLSEQTQEKEIIDLDVFLDNIGGDEQFCRDILKECLLSIPEQIEKIKISLKKGLLEEGLMAAHSIKGNFANIEAKSLNKIAFELEDLIKEKNMKKIPEILEIIEKEFIKLQKLVDKFLNKENKN